MHIIAGTAFTICLNHQLRLWPFLFDIHIDSPWHFFQHLDRLSGNLEQLFRVRAREFDRQVRRSPISILGHAIDNRLCKIKSRRGKLGTQLEPNLGDQILLGMLDPLIHGL